jgi:hypothetical protein
MLKADPLFSAIWRAYYDARRNKRNTINQLEFEWDLENNLYQLYLEVKNREYKISSGVAFIVEKPVRREIFAATFQDRVIHHLVYNLIVDFWNRQFIYDSYSCQVGKGTHFGIRRVERFMRAVTNNYTRKAYVLKLDILGYFMNMNRELVWQRCKEGLEKMSARGLLTREQRELLDYLLPIIIFHDPTKDVRIRGALRDWDDLPASKSLFCTAAGCGLPIGNVTSQLFSNIYLHPLDTLIKYRLGMKYYGRYVDDLVILDQDRGKLLSVKKTVGEFLERELHLQLHSKKTQLHEVALGIDFLGARIRKYRVEPGKRLVKNYLQLLRTRKEVSNFEQQHQSYLGHLGQFRGVEIATDGGRGRRRVRLLEVGSVGGGVDLSPPQRSKTHVLA